MGKLLVIEGTDCSGKETQSNLLMEKLIDKGYKVKKISFPNYNSPTGKIIGGPYLGKKEICDTWFDDPTSLDPKVSSLYYAADRRNELENILKLKEENDYLIMDRYVYSNMAHQGGKISDINERKKLFEFIDKLEFLLLELPRPDKVIFLYMPYSYATLLKKNRSSLDKHEQSKEHLINAEKTYLELSNIYSFSKIDCVKEGKILSVDEISSLIMKEI